MQKVTILCTGRMKERFYIDAAAEYAKRLSRFCDLQIVELPEDRLPDQPSPAQIAASLDREATVMLGRIPASARVCALCVEGTLCSSEDLAQWMGRNQDHALAFLIGGSFGLAPQVKERGDWKLSLSPMTFPHHLARVMLLEQIYRAYQIRSGGAYHK